MYIVGLLILFELFLSASAQCKPINGVFYHGLNCSIPCSEGCASTCQRYSGVCDDGCKTGWFGDFCDIECSFNCVENTCYRNGSCNVQLGCVHGYYGLDCTDMCTEVCNDGTCNRDAGNCAECGKPVDEQTPLCRNAACRPAGTWGLFCQFNCTENCADGTCSRDDGTCTACKPEKYGQFCSNDCLNCGTDRCYQSDGVCIDSCDPGWYQLDCMAPCKHDGCLECDRNTGECISCKAGKYGTNCSLECATTCASNNNGVITCNRFSGECDTKACKTGYYTPQCTKRCSLFCQSVACDIDSGTCAPCVNGWYGQRCDGECSSRCKNNDCEVLEDNCRLGCRDGYWGGSCEKTCNVNCDSKACNVDTAACLYGCNATTFFGMTCAEPCNGNCVEDICNRTGYCLKGCEVGWYGYQCQYKCQDDSKCTDGTCERLAGICEDCNTATPGPNCPTAECPIGKRGSSCEEDCTSSNCLHDQCGRYTDKCNACPAGYYGDNCELTCSRCNAGTGCDQTTGECDGGCKDGWYRPDCNTNCSSVCGSCEMQSGECVTCAAGRWGTTCDLTCSSNCFETLMNGNNLVLCDKASGKCSEQACKVGFWREDCTQACNSNCLQDDNNNLVCEFLDGECSKGCKERYYGKTCSGLCSTRCREQLCTDFEDKCDLGCADGYFGATCSGTCSFHCAGQRRCDPSTGGCFDGCELGYYGLRCDDQCKETCNDGTCNDAGGCTDCGLDPVGPNCRVQVCGPGLYGPTCESKCPGNYCINNQCKRTTGICENGCLDGYHGAYCSEVCQCDRSGTSECEQAKGECLCRPGSHGVLCDQRCSTGCIDFTCERDGTCTLGCKSGQYGPKCEDACTNCFNNACNSANGNCLQGCMGGWYGPQCNLACKTECKTCDIQTGECKSCVNNYYSFPACDNICSINCNIQGYDRTCNQVNGDCIYGCKTGYYGLDCSEPCGNCDKCNANDGSCPACNAGWWGTTCRKQCSSYCAMGESSNIRMCRQSDGYCKFGCKAGYYGETCSSTCISPNCANDVCDRQTGTCTAGCLSFFYDTYCDRRCDTCNSGLCEQANGYCIGDCPANSYGNQCEKECLKPLCTDETCDRYFGYCIDCRISPTGPRCSVQDTTTTTIKPGTAILIDGVVVIEMDLPAGTNLNAASVYNDVEIKLIATLSAFFRRFTNALLEIIITDIRVGSTIANYSVRYGTADKEVASQLVEAIVELEKGTEVTYDGQTVHALSDSYKGMELCEVLYSIVGSCGEGYKCNVENGNPVCSIRKKRTEVNVTLIIGGSAAGVLSLTGAALLYVLIGRIRRGLQRKPRTHFPEPISQRDDDEAADVYRSHRWEDGKVVVPGARLATTKFMLQRVTAEMNVFDQPYIMHAKSVGSPTYASGNWFQRERF